ncbi:MAG: hypothetical protein ACE5LU_19265, partial [Anaerolineae bacterium]
RIGIILLAAALFVSGLVLGSIGLTSDVLAQPPQPVSHETDFLVPVLTLDDVQSAVDLQWHHFPRLFTGSADDADFQTALGNAVTAARDYDWGEGDEGVDLEIRYRVVNIRGSAGNSETPGIVVTILAGLVREELPGVQ